VSTKQHVTVGFRLTLNRGGCLLISSR